MKKIILIGILLVAVILRLVYLNNFSNKKNDVNQKLTEGDVISVYRLEDLNLSYSKTDIGDFNEKFYEENNIKTTYVELPFRNIKFIENYHGNNKKVSANLSIYVIKNANSGKLSINKWLDIDSNNPESDKQAPISYKQEDIVVSGGQGTRHYFSSKEGRVDFPLYELVTLYIPHKTDIYQINYYVLPGNPDQVLSQEDIKNALEYEKIVDLIIQSIKFVD